MLHQHRGLTSCVQLSHWALLQCAAACWSVLQCVAVCYSVLQCVAVCYSVLPCVAVCCSELRGFMKKDLSFM